MKKIQIEKQKISEVVSSHLEQQIIDGTLVKGDYLPPERELMEAFGVGRPAIREALFILQNKGLISTRNGMRATVSEPDINVIMNDLSGVVGHMLINPEGQKNLFEARVFMEVGLVRNASINASDKDMDGLEKILKQNHDSIDNLERFQQTDMDFHRFLAEIPNNPIFAAVRQSIYLWLKVQSEKTLAKPGQTQIAYNFHKKIFDKLSERDADGAEKAMRDHMNQSYEIFLSYKSND